MKRMMAVAVLIPLLFSGCASESKRKVQPIVQPVVLAQAVQIPEFKSDSVDVTYLQRSVATSNVIAVVPISGEVSEGDSNNADMVEDVESVLRVAAEDYRVKAIVLKVNSPGGTVNASNLIWNDLMKFKRTGKPVIAFFNGTAASGAYYISVAADKIIATPETWTGSIGVIMQVADYSGKFKKDGIKVVTIKSGPHKDMLSPYKPAEKSDLEIMQRIINASFDRFVQKVADGRHMNESVVRILADGRIYDADQALKNGLIDQVGYIEDSFEAAKDLANIKDASLVLLENKTAAAPSIISILKGRSSIESDHRGFPYSRTPELYYLWTIDD